MSNYYGMPPVEVTTEFDLPDWQEFMHYLYLPVRLPAHDRKDWGLPDEALPDRLAFLEQVIDRAVWDASQQVAHLQDPYVYVTARRGFATPGNPLNRPGWHCDDFGGTDLNYVWCDEFPTRVLRADPGSIDMPADDVESMRVMDSVAEMIGWPGADDVWIEPIRTHTMYRLTPHVIHDTPIIPAPGGMRSFFKISVSNHRYDLIGNSHNHLLDYDWPMVSRDVLRNQPSGGNKDYSR